MIQHLVDTCTILRETTGSADPYGNVAPPHGSMQGGVPCLLVERTEQAADSLTGQVSIRTWFRLYVGADVDIEPGDRVTSVTRADGAAADGTFEVVAAIARRSAGGLIAFRSCELERVI